jgi:hypothetical protein
MMKIAEETGRNPLMVQSTEDFLRMIDFVMFKPPFKGTAGNTATSEICTS